MCHKCDNSVIMKINEIIVLLYSLLHLYHDFFNPRVGHHALLGGCHVMTLLLHYYDPFWHYYDRLPLWHYYDMHTTCVIICIICHNHAIKYFLSWVIAHFVSRYALLLHCYYLYDTIIHIMTWDCRKVQTE